MSQQDIVEYPNDILRQRAADVLAFDQSLQTLIQNLNDTLRASTGIGLSAPQIGESLRVFVMDNGGSSSGYDVFVNPVINSKAGFAVVNESCLSLPGINANVIRAAQVTVTSHDGYGNPSVRELEGMQAVCIQHELDHLDGKLFIDRVSRLRSLRFRKALKAMEINAHNANEATPSIYSPS